MDPLANDYSGSSLLSEAGLLKRLMSLGHRNKVPSMKPVRAVGQPQLQPQPQPQSQSRKAPTIHIASYAVNRGRGFLRVGVKGDNQLTKARLHIFKKGDRYYGFLVVPGPGRTKSESISDYMAVLSEMDLFESASDVVLRYDSDDLGDLFDLSKYQKRSNLSVSKFNQYETEVKLLDADVAEKAKIGRLPWGKQEREIFRQEDPVDIDLSKAQELSNRYSDLAKKEQDGIAKFIYEFMSEAMSKISSQDDIKKIIQNTQEAIKRNQDRGDSRSLRKAQIYQQMIDDFLDVVGELEIR